MTGHTVFNYPEWSREIRQRDGRKCVKCGYRYASVYAVGDGHMLCNACADEWEALAKSGRSPVTAEEWLKLPSLIQFIATYRKQLAKDS